MLSVTVVIGNGKAIVFEPSSSFVPVFSLAFQSSTHRRCPAEKWRIVFIELNKVQIVRSSENTMNK